MQDLDGLQALLKTVALPENLAGRVTFSGPDQVLPSSYRTDLAARVTIGAVGAAVAEMHFRRSGMHQEVSVETTHAAAEFSAERVFTVNDAPTPELFDPLAGAYLCGDGRWVRIHTNFAHHRDGILSLLNATSDREKVEQAFLGWEAEAFETAASKAKMIAALFRTQEEWQAHPQGGHLIGKPVITLEKIGDAPIADFVPGERPLSGLRVLDLTRIIAGPTCGRALAAHGADVMRIASPYLPFIESLVMVSGAGKRSAYADLETTAGRQALENLLRDADVFVEGYRPGGLAERGFSPQRLADLRPGIVSVSLSAYGFEGPWAGKRGFDSIVQTACGINHGEALDASRYRPSPKNFSSEGLKPRALPCQALDHASGYLMAFGTVAALLRRMEEGGSWRVQVSLAQTATWLTALGRVEGGTQAPPLPKGWADPYLDVMETPFGRLRTVRPAARLSRNPPYFDKPAVPLGTHEAVWTKSAPWQPR